MRVIEKNAKFERTKKRLIKIECDLQCNNDRVSTFSTDRSSCPISILKATFIRTLQSNLCRQKRIGLQP